MKLTLVKKVQEAPNTYSFFFKPYKSFSWIPGQYLYVTLTKLKYPDKRGNTRHFTIANSPTEGGFIQITTRIRESSGYKKTLDELSIASVVETKGPNGLFVFDENTNKKCRANLFLAGGIGITPFRSIIKYNIDKFLSIPMHLVYSNSDGNFVFKDELDNWSEKNEIITVDYIDTSKEDRLNKEKVSSFIPSKNITNTIVWVVGPPLFVSSMEDALEELKIPQDNIKTEKFTGY